MPIVTSVLAQKAQLCGELARPRGWDSNLASAAWHMIDWAWVEIAENPAIKARITAAESAPPARFSLGEFKTFDYGPPVVSPQSICAGGVVTPTADGSGRSITE